MKNNYDQKKDFIVHCTMYYNIFVVPKLMKTMILLRNIREFTLFGYLIN